jgi:hypothetical protein
MNGSNLQTNDSSNELTQRKPNNEGSKPDYTPAYTVLIRAYLRKRSKERQVKTQENYNGETAL